MIKESKDQITKIQLTITLILIMFFCITGATYAYFAISATNNNTITGTAATVNLTLSVTKVFPSNSSTNTGVLVPQISKLDNGTNVLSTALKNGCVDTNQNVVCQVYKITIKNEGGTATQVVDGSVSFFSDQNLTSDISTAMPNLKWKPISSVDETTPSNSIIGDSEDLQANFNKNIFANDVTLVTNATSDYYIIVWINETNVDQPSDEGKTFYGIIEFDSSNGTGVTSTFNS